MCRISSEEEAQDSTQKWWQIIFGNIYLDPTQQNKMILNGIFVENVNNFIWKCLKFFRSVFLARRNWNSWNLNIWACSARFLLSDKLFTKNRT
jgi:hypothetical protein